MIAMPVLDFYATTNLVYAFGDPDRALGRSIPAAAPMPSQDSQQQDGGQHDHKENALP